MPQNSYEAWEAAKQARRQDPKNPELIQAEIDAERYHFKTIGVEFRPDEPTFWERNKAVIQGTGGCIVILLIALVGYFAFHANDQNGEQGRELNNLVAASPCAPPPGEPTKSRDPAACKRNIRLGLESLTPAQTCYLVANSQPVLMIDGRLHQITCTVGLIPAEKEKRQTEGKPTSKTPTPPSAGAVSTEKAEKTTSTGTTGSESAPQTPQGTSQSPSGGNQGGNGGSGGKHPSEGGSGNGGGESGSTGGGETSGTTATAPTTPEATGSTGTTPTETGTTETGGGTTTTPTPPNAVAGVTEGLGGVVGTVMGNEEGTVTGTLCSTLNRLAGLCH